MTPLDELRAERPYVGPTTRAVIDAVVAYVEVLEAAASVPPPAEDAMEVLAEDLRRVYAPVPDHILHDGEWWKADQVVQSRTVFHGYACDKYEVTFPQGDVALNADRRRRVVVLVPLYDDPAVPSSKEPTE